MWSGRRRSTDEEPINPSSSSYSINQGPQDFEDVPLIEADGRFPKTRHILGFLGFLGFANVYAMRVNLNVAIVAMVNHTAIPTIDNVTDTTCPVPPDAGNSTIPAREGEFDWDEGTQSIVLGAFFYGYVLTQIPGGRLAELLGGKLIYGYGVLITAIFTFLTPIAARFNLPALILVRVLEGIGEGVTFPAMHAMLARWVPPLERSKFAALVYAGANFGTIISLPLSGWMCTLEWMGGWPLAFYVFGALGCLWFIAWMCFVSDSPAVHPRISPEEREFIQRATRTKDDELLNPEEIEAIPWGDLLTCLPLWAILVTQCGQAWVFYTQLTELPTYMNRVLHVGVTATGFLAALPYLTAWLFGIGCSTLADYILARGWISQVNSYKIWNSIASIGPSVGLVAIAWAGCDGLLVTILLAGAGALQGAVYPGNQMNHIALSPRFAGTMYGMTNAAGNICGFLAPYIIGLIIKGNETVDSWRLVFYLGAFLNMMGNFFYLLFASAEEQAWSKRRPQQREITGPS